MEGKTNCRAAYSPRTPKRRSWKMEIRPAALADLDAIMEIYEHARTYMAEQGNASQ